jgi:hemerythrin
MSTRYQTQPIAWNETFSVGVDELDQHHRQLAYLINQLAEHSAEDVHSAAIVDILSALISYAEYHFNKEEELMARVDYCELESHRQEHLHFREVVAETCYGASLGIVGVKELFSYLTRWWRNHILLEDMKYKPYLARLPAHGCAA